MWFIIFWKVAGELQRPRYMTIGSYKPYLVLNAALCWSPSLIHTLLKPPSTSNFEKTNVSCTSVINSGMSGSEYLLRTVHLLTPLYSCTGLCDPSAFQRKKNDKAIGDMDGLM